jgi:sugar phosphate isomerase/epimerase
MNIDFDAVIKALKTIEYSGYFTLECGEYLNKFDKDNVHLGLRDMANAVKKLSEMYENL